MNKKITFYIDKTRVSEKKCAFIFCTFLWILEKVFGSGYVVMEEGEE